MLRLFCIPTSCEINNNILKTRDEKGQVFGNMAFEHIQNSGNPICNKCIRI